MSPGDCLRSVVEPALRRLPERMGSREARLLLLAIGLQESLLTYRAQVGGPARGLWQFERGTPETRGGVCGVLMHPATRRYVVAACEMADLSPTERAIYDRIETDDVLACVLARLLLWTDPQPLPADAAGGWGLYLRTWRPGRPRPDSWLGNWSRAGGAVDAATA